MRYPIAVIIIVFIALVYTTLSSAEDTPFAFADAMPRGALVYMEAAHLPWLIEKWRSSGFKDRYLDSRNFDELGRRHLGLKLASRWNEFSDAAGLPIDLSTIAGFATKRAALALYDIGKLEFVFIADLSPESFEALRLLGDGSRFSEEKHEEGFRSFRVRVEADSGRQRQDLLFTHHKGRFILATSENLLARTLDNINKKPGKNRLSDHAPFRSLALRSPAGDLAVWADQAALSNDYYFKRYWLMSDSEHLAKIRAGIFIFSIEENALVEKRLFLQHGLSEFGTMTNVPKDLLKYVPSNVPYFRARSTDTAYAAAETGRMIRFGKDEPVKKRKMRPNLYPQSSTHYFDDYYYGRYERDLETKIDEIDETIKFPQRTVSYEEIVSALEPASPVAILRITNTRQLPDPHFVEFENVAVIRLRLPDKIVPSALESAVNGILVSETMTANSWTELEWKSSEHCTDVRVAGRPMIGWEAAYTVRNSELLIGNSAKMICEILNTHSSTDVRQDIGKTSEFTVIDVERTSESFFDVFSKLHLSRQDDIFTENIGSVINAVEASRIEFRRGYQKNIQSEELRLVFR